MLTPVPFAIESNGRSFSADGARSSDLATPCKRSLPSRTFLLLALGFAVLVWSSWWKCSLYNPHPAPPYKTLAARLWVGPLPDIGLRSAHLPAKSHLKSGLHSLRGSLSAQSDFACVARVAAAQNAPDAGRFFAAIASRPPPFQVSLHS